MKLTRAAFVCVTCFVLLSRAIAGGPAPNFVLKTADGTTLELEKLRGKAVVINFWATWCGPCRMEMPDMVKVYDKYKSKGLEVIGVSLDRGGWSDVKPFLAKNKVSYPIVVAGNDLAMAYGGIEGIPTTFFVDRKGMIAFKHVGLLTEEQFEKAVKAIL